ncbi:MAG: serine--tRNA ligase, partial [Deltaproteobacteria bacterium]|nr:serine--tRNA ligase [Deltaproteobacteria bacterium]
MIDLKILQKDPERVARALAARCSGIDMAEFQALDTRRRALLTEVEELRGRRNAASEEVAQAKRAGRD